MGQRRREQPHASVCAAVHQWHECNRRDRPAKLQRRFTQSRANSPDISDPELPTKPHHRATALLTVRRPRRVLSREPQVVPKRVTELELWGVNGELDQFLMSATHGS